MNYFEKQFMHHIAVFEELGEHHPVAAHFLQECHEMRAANDPPLMAMGDHDA
jgi:hypothetical protein